MCNVQGKERQGMHRHVPSEHDHTDGFSGSSVTKLDQAALNADEVAESALATSEA